MNDITVTLPRPHPLQVEIMRSPAKYKVVCAGRRAGKTTLAALIAVERFLAGEKILLTSTTQDQSDVFWDKIKDWLYPLIQAKLIHKNETKRIMESRAIGGRIRVKTGSTPDVLRGDDADLIVFDECALLDPDTWYAVAAPMLADRDGSAVFISTPNRRNWFYNLYLKGYDDSLERWQSWHFTTLANPYLSQKALGELASNMTAEMYQQEILAEFLAGEGAVFRGITEAATAVRREPYAGHFVMGVDWAQQKDYTVLMVMDLTTGAMVDYDRFNQQDWALQRGRLQSLAHKWQVELIIAETNSIGSPNIEALQRLGLPVQGFTTTGQSKPPLIEGLVLAIERKDITLFNEPVLIRELEAYERRVNAFTGHSQYSAPDGLHDDMVMALALANYGRLQGIRSNFVFL